MNNMSAAGHEALKSTFHECGERAARGSLARRMSHWVLAATASLALLSACGGGSSEAPVASEGSATITAAGGVVDGPDGVRLTVPAAALVDTTTIRIARDSTGAPELGGAKLISAVYAITPHGTAFAESARLSIPFDPASVAPGTQPVLLKAQPGGGWTALSSDVVGTTLVAADTPSLSYYAVGTCYTSRDASVSGPDPLLYCPSAHQLTLTLQDNSGVAVPVPRNSGGVAQPVMTISSPTTLNFTVYWNRPAGTSRSDVLNVIAYGAGLLPAQQPLRDFAVNNNNFAQPLQVNINPATVPGAGQPGGVVVRVRASATYTTDAFYPGCLCFRAASWNFETEVPVRVMYRGMQPTITQQPANRAVTAGQTATFTVAATGQALSYQWLRGSAAIAGATGASYTTGATATSDNGASFVVRVCTTLANPVETVCVNSNAAQLSVSAVTVAPTFTTAPQSVTVTEGETVSFSAVANGQPAPTIGWSRLDSGGFGTVYTPVCGLTTGTGSVTSASCSLGQVTRASNGARFIAAATNSAGSVDSGIITLTVLALPVAPTITSSGELRDQTITAGGSASWTVTASGTAPINYTWYAVNSGGARQALACPDGSTPSRTISGGTLTLTNVQPGCNGLRVDVAVGNSVGVANPPARVATLTVNSAPAAPTITMPLANRAVLDGAQVTFSVAATGTPASFSYGWTFNGAAVPRIVSGCNTASASCTFTAMLEDSGSTVAVSVANGLAPNAQSNATLTVTTNDVAASITAQPGSQSVIAGASATFTVGTAGTPTPAVQWQTSTDGVNWTDVGTGSSFTVSNAMLSQNGLLVRAVVSNTTRVPGGTQPNSVTSSVATLSVVDNIPPDALTAVQVLTVASRTMAVRADGSVYAWGMYVSPVHGAYSSGGAPTYRPTRIQGLGPVQQVAIGSDYASWALGRDGTVWGWGFLNSYQAFAQGPNDSTLQFYSPVRVLTAANTPIDRVCQIEGTLYGVVMVRSDVVGGTCAANEPRSVWYTGGSLSGSEATSQNDRYARRFAPLDSAGSLLPSGRWIREVVTSRIHGSNVMTVFAITNDGNVYAWGNSNSQGQLGLGHQNAANTPQLAPGWAGATRISAGGHVTLAVMADGSLRGAGWNANASLGIGPESGTVISTPTAVPGIAGAGDVSTAYATSMALVGGELRYWGNGGRFAAGSQATPIPITAPATPLTAVSTGTYVAVVIGPGGVVYSWGDATLRGCAPNGTDCNAATTTPAIVTLPPAAPAGMSLLAGDFSGSLGVGSGDGIGTAARFDTPEGLTADRAGNLFVAQSNISRVAKIAPDAVVTTVYRPTAASNTNFGSLAFAPDGSLYTAAVSWCGLFRTAAPPSAGSVTQALTVSGCPTIETRGIAVDSNGVVHISQTNGSVSRIGAPDVNGNAMATVFVGAVNPYVAPGSVDANGTAARFNASRGIAFDVYGNLFVADTGNHTIRRVTPTGDVTTFVGAPGAIGTVDGNGAAARFNNPTDLAFDGAGMLYVLERGDGSNGNAAVVRRVTPAGEVTTLFNVSNEAAALAAPGQEGHARTIRGMALIGSGRLAFSAGNAVLVRTLP